MNEEISFSLLHTHRLVPSATIVQALKPVVKHEFPSFGHNRIYLLTPFVTTPPTVSNL